MGIFFFTRSDWENALTKVEVSSLKEPLQQPIESVVTSALLTLLPAELALETYNSQYLQRHSTSAKSLLSVARVLFLLKAPQEQIDSTVFSILNPEVQMDIKVRMPIMSENLQLISSYFHTKNPIDRSIGFRILVGSPVTTRRRIPTCV